MIKSKRYLLHVIKVDSNRLEYILTHLDEFYYSFDKPKFDKLTGKPKRDGAGNIKKRTFSR